MYIGIDLGGTNIAVGLVDDGGKIIYKDSLPTGRERHYSQIIKDMAELSLKVIVDSGNRLDDVKAIGIGSPGTPDKENGVLVYTNNLDFNYVPMREEMQKHIKLPVFLDNDANCAALAEAVTGAAKGTKHSITITLGTGVGSGIVIDGKIYSGFNDSGAELGHTVICIDGEQCTCGRKGCWEAYASATALIRQTKEAVRTNPDSLINKMIEGNTENVSGKTAFEAARQGDEAGKMVVENYIKYIAEGLVNTINIFQPNVVVIGGGICKEGDYLLNPLREFIKKNVYCKQVEQTRIETAVLGNDAGIIGAAMLGR